MMKTTPSWGEKPHRELLPSHTVDAPATYKPLHALSTKSEALQRNLFVWDKADGLQGGLHLADDSPVTISTLYRWIELVLSSQRITTRWLHPNSPPVKAPPLELYSVTIEFGTAPGPFNYYIKPNDNDHVLSRDSKDPLHPCDLGIRPMAPRRGLSFPFDELCMLELEERRRKRNEEVKYSLSNAEFTTHVLERDNHHCAITGAETSLTVTWIYPPWLGTRSCGFRGDEELRDDVQKYLDVTNALTLHTDVADLFQRNCLAIDVDDDYRVVFFTPQDASFFRGQNLRLTAMDSESSQPPSDDFLRRHLLHCLLVSFVGGDVVQEYGRFDWGEFLGKHLKKDEEGKFDIETRNADDPVWQTTVGKEALRVLEQGVLLGYDSEGYDSAEDSAE